MRHTKCVEELRESPTPATKIDEEMEETQKGHEDALHICGNQKEGREYDGQEYVDTQTF